MEYKGFEIRVSPGFFVLGEDPMAPVSAGFVAEVCKLDAVQDDPDGRPMLDFPYGMAASHLEAATEDEAIALAKAFIDAGGKMGRDPLTRHEEE